MRSFYYTRRGDVTTYRAERIDAHWWRSSWLEGDQRRSARYADAAVAHYVESGTWTRIDIPITKGYSDHMKTLYDLRSSIASWIDAQAVADLKRAWRFANRADQALHEHRTLIAFLLLAAHGYYLSRGDHRHDAAELIRPPTAGDTHP